MGRLTVGNRYNFCGLCTHKCSTYRVAQHDHISSCEHACLKSWEAQDCTSLCPKNKCHPCVMSHPLPHLTLTTSTSSLSPISSTSPIFPMVSPTHRRSVVHDPYLPHGRVADQHKSHLSQFYDGELQSSNAFGHLKGTLDSKFALNISRSKQSRHGLVERRRRTP